MCKWTCRWPHKKWAIFSVTNWPFNALPMDTDTKVDSRNIKTLCGNFTSILCMLHLHTLTFVIKQFPGSKHCGNNEKKVGLRNQAGCHAKWQWLSAHFLIQTSDALSSSNIMTMSVNFSVQHTTVKSHYLPKNLQPNKFLPQKSGQCHKKVEHVWPTWFWDKNIDFKLLSTCKTIWLLYFGPVWDDNSRQWDNSKMTH